MEPGKHNTYLPWQIETEITKVTLLGIEEQLLDGSGFRGIREAPAPFNNIKPPSEINDPVVLSENLKGIIRDIANNLLAEEGIGSHELGYFYGVLINHVSQKMLAGKTVGTASVEELRYAINCRNKVQLNFRNRPGLVDSIIKYKREVKNGN